MQKFGVTPAPLPMPCTSWQSVAEQGFCCCAPIIPHVFDHHCLTEVKVTELGASRTALDHRVASLLRQLVVLTQVEAFEAPGELGTCCYVLGALVGNLILGEVKTLQPWARPQGLADPLRGPIRDVVVTEPQDSGLAWEGRADSLHTIVTKAAVTQIDCSDVGVVGQRLGHRLRPLAVRNGRRHRLCVLCRLMACYCVEVGVVSSNPLQRLAKLKRLFLWKEATGISPHGPCWGCAPRCHYTHALQPLHSPFRTMWHCQ